MATNLKLFTIFIIYALLELVFAKLYFGIYEDQPSHYAFDQAVIDQKISEVQLSHQKTINNNSKVRYLESLIKVMIGDGVLWSGRSKQVPFNGQLYYSDSLVFLINYIKYPPNDFYDIDVFGTEGNEIASFRLSNDLGFTLRDRLKNTISELNNEASHSKEVLSKLKSNEPFPVWSYWDFVYFSNRKITGEIIPNNSSVRRLATLQDFTHIILLGFLINASFGIFKWFKNRNAPSI